MLLKFLFYYCYYAAFMFYNAFGQIPDPTPPECYNVNVSEQDLTEFIFQNYSGTVERPRFNAMHTVNLNLTLAISSINDVLEKERVIRVTAYLALRWFDEFHTWNHTFPQNCIPYIVLPADKVWRPDIAQINDKAGRYTLSEMPGEKIRLHSNGFTTYSPGGTFDAFCDFDFTLFPFDTQRCAIQIESWRYTSSFVSFHIGSPTKTYQWWENDQWSLLSTDEKLFTEEYTFNDMTFDRVEFYIHIQRKSKFYLLNIVLPSVVISLAQISVFTLPLAEAAKLEVSFTCLLAYSVFQLMIAEDMPRSSDRVPLISVYIGLKMLYLAICMLGQGTVFILLHRAEDNYCQIPTWFYRTVEIVGKLLLVSKTPTFSSPNTTNGSEANEAAVANRSARQNSLSSANNRRENKSGDDVDLMKASLSEFESLNLLRGIGDEPLVDNISTEMQLSMLKSFISLEIQKAKNKRQEPSATSETIRKKQWIYAARVADRFTCCLYICGVLFTPLILFSTAVLFFQ